MAAQSALSLRAQSESQSNGFRHAKRERDKTLDAPFQKIKTTVINTNTPENAFVSASPHTESRSEDLFTTELTDLPLLSRVVSFSVDKIVIPLSFETVNFVDFTKELDFVNDPVVFEPADLMVFLVGVYYYRQQLDRELFDRILIEAEIHIAVDLFEGVATNELTSGSLVVRGHWTPSLLVIKINDILKQASVQGKIRNGDQTVNGLADRFFPFLGSPRSFRLCYDPESSRFVFERSAPIEPLPPSHPGNLGGEQTIVIDTVQVAVRNRKLAEFLGFGTNMAAFTQVLPQARNTEDPVQLILLGAVVTKTLAPLAHLPFGPAFLTLMSTLPISQKMTGGFSKGPLSIIPVQEKVGNVELTTPSTEFESVFTFQNPQSIPVTQSFWFENDKGKRVYFISDRRWSVTLTFMFIPG